MPGLIVSIGPFASTELILILPKSAGGEAVNAQVCKTCNRGFNSRPALQIIN